MKTIEIIGFKRANLGKAEAKRLREEGNVPCVLYGGQVEQLHFYVPAILFRPLVYTPDANLVDLNIEGEKHQAILQETQFHPVSEMMLHADFLAVNDKKEVKMDIPVKLVGKSPGVTIGGRMVTKMRKIKVKALPQNLPDFIEVDVSGMELGKSIKVETLKPNNYEILTNPLVSIATVEIPRSMRSKQSAEAAAEEEGES